MINIKKELAKVEHKARVINAIKRAYNIICSFTCQHKECFCEYIDVQLGKCTNSILSEILGEEVKDNPQKMRIKIVRCARCHRELSREYLPVSEQ